MKTYNDIVLSDGTAIKCVLNGNCYISEAEVTEDMLSDDNLIAVTINGVEHQNMTCPNVWKDADEYWFILRERTHEELKQIEIEAKLDFLMAMQGVEV